MLTLFFYERRQQEENKNITCFSLCKLLGMEGGGRSKEHTTCEADKKKKKRRKDKARDVQKKRAGEGQSGGESSKVALAVEGGGEGHVVEGPGHAIGARIRGHAGYAVLRLVGGQLPPQFVRQDVILLRARLI